MKRKQKIKAEMKCRIEFAYACRPRQFPDIKRKLARAKFRLWVILADFPPPKPGMKNSPIWIN